MIQPQDEQSVMQILRCQEVPEAVRSEYETRLRMYHSAGASGPLGVVGLIDLVRSLKLAPPEDQPKDEPVDWRGLPQDGSVRVEARYFGGWLPGVFRGFVEAGTLAVQLDNDANVRECSRDIVRLAREGTPPPPADAPPMPLDSAREQGEPVSPAEADTVDFEAADAPPVDWSAVAPGAAVWVEYGDEIVDGVLVSVSGDALLVKFGDEERTCNASLVTQAS